MAERSLSWMRRWTLLVMVFSVLCFLAPLVAPALIPVAAWSVLGIPLALVALVATLVISLRWGDYLSTLLVIGGLWWGFSYAQRMVRLPLNASYHSNTTPHLRVLTYNQQRLYSMGEGQEQNTAVDHFVDSIVRTGADVVCFQEVGIADKLSKAMGRAGFVYTAQANTLPQLLTFSKWPIQESGVVFASHNHINGCTYADLQISDQLRVRVYNVHFESNNQLEQRKFPDQQLSKTQEQLHTVRSYVFGAQIRSHQVQKLLAHVQASEQAVVLAGDLNDVSHSYVYQQLQSDLSDAFRIAGSGLGHTYRGKLPLLRIDYVMASSHWIVTDYQRHRWPYSDHFAVQADVRLSP